MKSLKTIKLPVEIVERLSTYLMEERVALIERALAQVAGGHDEGPRRLGEWAIEPLEKAEDELVLEPLHVPYLRLERITTVVPNFVAQVLRQAVERMPEEGAGVWTKAATSIVRLEKSVKTSQEVAS